MKFNFWKTIFIPMSIGTLATQVALTGCSSSIRQYYNNYSDKYYSDWFKSITKGDNFDWKTQEANEITADNEAQAIMLYTYGDGWAAWNNRLHKYYGNIPAEEMNLVVDGSLILPNDGHHGEQPLSFSWVKKTKIRVSDYQILESALNKSKCGKMTIYSGSENDQIDLYNQLNTILNINYDWKDGDPLLFRAKDPKVLVGKTLTNHGFMSTSLNKNHAWSFLYNAEFNGFKNGIFYDIDVDENTKGGLVSDDRQFFGKNQYMLGFRQEWQMVVQRNLKLEIVDAYWTSTIADTNVLYLKCKGYHNK